MKSMSQPTQSPLEIKQLELGPMENYIYIVSNKITKDCVVIDPAWDVEAIKKEIKNSGLNLKAALITHGHPDHTNGIEKLLKDFDIPIMVSEAEASFYKPIGENIIDVKKNHVLSLGNNEAPLEINFVHTPGHTPGSQCFFIKTAKKTYSQTNELQLEAQHILMSGDTLFLDGCGRCDLPGGNAEIMFDSIANILMKMPNDTVIFPGHNYHHYCCDSLANQKETNPYLQFDNLKNFINKRTGR
jgi:glyoxylase-like metal-dependent hydrolase (beta-lactamase superfamily II)